MRRISEQRDATRNQACRRSTIGERPFAPFGSGAKQISRGFVPTRKARFKKFRRAEARPEIFASGRKSSSTIATTLMIVPCRERIMDEMRLAPEPKGCFLAAHRGRSAVGLDDGAPRRPPGKFQIIWIEFLPDEGSEPVGADQAIACCLQPAAPCAIATATPSLPEAKPVTAASVCRLMRPSYATASRSARCRSARCTTR